jgi:hypothetical protein
MHPSEASLKTFCKLHFIASPVTALRSEMKREERNKHRLGLYSNCLIYVKRLSAK